MNCRRPPYNVIVYAGGKTGGTSIFQTLLQRSEYRCIHIHNDRCFRASCIHGIPPFIQSKDPPSIFELIDTVEPVYIIDVYRNPIDRKISSYFQNLEHNRKYYNVPKDIGIEDEVDFFTINIFPHLENYEAISEPMTHYGIDKLDYKFTHWVGRKKNITFIRLKFTEIDNWFSILRKYIPDFPPLMPSNLSKEKKYYARYKLFKKIFVERYLY